MVTTAPEASRQEQRCRDRSVPEMSTGMEMQRLSSGAEGGSSTPGFEGSPGRVQRESPSDPHQPSGRAHRHRLTPRQDVCLAVAHTTPFLPPRRTGVGPEYGMDLAEERGEIARRKRHRMERQPRVGPCGRGSRGLLVQHHQTPPTPREGRVTSRALLAWETKCHSPGT